MNGNNKRTADFARGKVTGEGNIRLVQGVVAMGRENAKVVQTNCASGGGAVSSSRSPS